MEDQKRLQSVPLRIPVSTRTVASQFAQLEGVSLNFFISSAIAERIGRLERNRMAAVQHRPRVVRVQESAGQDDAPHLTPPHMTHDAA